MIKWRGVQFYNDSLTLDFSITAWMIITISWSLAFWKCCIIYSQQDWRSQTSSLIIKTSTAILKCFNLRGICRCIAHNRFSIRLSIGLWTFGRKDNWTVDRFVLNRITNMQLPINQAITLSFLDHYKNKSYPLLRKLVVSGYYSVAYIVISVHSLTKFENFILLGNIRTAAFSRNFRLSDLFQIHTDQLKNGL